MNQREDYVEIDLLQILGVIRTKFKTVIAVTLICGILAASISFFIITPKYKAQTLLYVNNNSISLGSAELSISQGDISAAQSLVDTYIVILKSRTTLTQIIKKAHLSYDYETLYKMIKAAPVNSTEIFSVEVLSKDPAEAEKIANTIGQVLPKRIASIVDGSSVRIVDYAVLPAKKDSPNNLRNTILGAVIGLIVSSAYVIVKSLMDTKVKDADYLTKTYDIPVLAVIPDLLSSKKSEKVTYEDSYYGQVDKTTEAR